MIQKPNENNQIQKQNNKNERKHQENMIHLDLSYGWYLKTATDNFISHGTTHKHAVPTQNRPHSTHTQLTIMCPSGFSASSTAEEVTQGIDGSGLTAIVTGYISFFFSFFSFLKIWELSLPCS